MIGVARPWVNLRWTRDLGLRRSRKVGSIGSGRTATDKHGIVRRLDNRLSFDVVERKFSETQRKVNRLRLAWVERNTSKALQIAHRLLGARASHIDIALNDLSGAAFSGIGDCGGCDYRLAFLIAHQRGRADGLGRKRNAGVTKRRVG